MAHRIRVDIISDIVCPWCFIGYRQLRKALQIAELEGDIRFHPFELNPDMPPEGEDVAEHIRRKYGGTDDESPATWRKIREIGATLGIDFTNKSKRIWNTAKAHQLVHWAQESGQQTELEPRLFEAYFVDGRNVSADDVLLEVAADAGLDAAEAAQVLADGRYAETVATQEERWRSMGITGVPAMIIAERGLVMGAQDAAALARALSKMAAAPAG